MKVSDLVTVLDREAQILSSENWHASAVVIQQAASKLRELAYAMRCARLDPDSDPSGGDRLMPPPSK